MCDDGHLVNKGSLVKSQWDCGSGHSIELNKTHSNFVGAKGEGVGKVNTKLSFLDKGGVVDGTRFVKDQHDILFLGALGLRAVGRSGSERVSLQANNVKEIESFAVGERSLADDVIVAWFNCDLGNSSSRDVDLVESVAGSGNPIEIGDLDCSCSNFIAFSEESKDGCFQCFSLASSWAYQKTNAHQSTKFKKFLNSTSDLCVIKSSSVGRKAVEDICSHGTNHIRVISNDNLSLKGLSSNKA